MFEEMAEMVFGPIGFAAVAIIGLSNTQTGRRALRSGVKTAVKAGYYIGEKGSAILGELKEQAEEVVEEAKAERSGNERPRKARVEA